jgi:hypothetical protein
MREINVVGMDHEVAPWFVGGLVSSAHGFPELGYGHPVRWILKPGFRVGVGLGSDIEG